MATINSVQKSIHLPLSGLGSPRVLMCSASVGTEGSVTLQLRDANSSDSNQSPAPTSLDNALTIGYPDPEMLADVLGTLQTASLKNNNSTTNNNNNNSSNSSISHSNNNNNNNTNNNNNNSNKITISRRNSSAPIKDSNKIAVQTVSTSTNTTNKTNSYIKNCLIRSSSCSSTNNVTSLAQIMSNSNSSLLNNTTNSNSNCSSNSNFSSSSNDSTISVTSSSNNSSSNHKSGGGGGGSGNYAHKHVPGSANSSSSGVKKSRPKLSSPTRHGPQQCQICSKIFGNASALAKHKLTHSDERKYVCAMCSKAFKRQDHLNGHMMTHRNKKPYECKSEGCGKSYCDARSLRRHTENHHAGIITPQNQTLSPTTGTPTGLSLSPATASGDASSPDGATCIRTYISSGGTVVDAATGVALTEEQIKAINLPIKTGVTLLSPTSTSSTASSSSGSGGCSSSMSISTSPTIALTEASLEGEGLTREQLDLISKIMQQTKQTSAQVTVSSPTSVNSYKVDTSGAPAPLSSPQNVLQNRPRTWNMQLLNSSQNVSITVDEATSDVSPISNSVVSPIDTKTEDELNQQLVAAINPHLLNIVKIDQKPVECNLCHRKFKNIPALNGHMRLHGGYFKKDPETKKSEKKESNGPPLQTASIGVRALIEEKIINKRSKDLNKGAFVVPAPPGSVASTTTIRRSISDLESFLSPKSTHSNSSCSSSSSSSSSNTAAPTAMLPSATTIKSGGLSIQQIGLPQSIEIFSTKQQKTVNNVSVGVGTTSTLTPTNSTTSPSTTRSTSTTYTTTTKSTSTDPKDSTLIELLKRGTRIAVTAKKSPNSTNMANSNTTLATTSRQIITNNNRTVIIPSDVQVVSTKSKSISGHSSRSSTPASISLSDATPLSLTISQSGGTNGDVYTVTYTSDTAGLFDDAEVYNVSDTEMLLQTVDSMQLLNDATDPIKSEHSEPFTLATTGNNSGGIIQSDIIKVESDTNGMVNMRSTGNVTSLPTFQQFHSKEIIMQNSSQLQALANMRSNTLTLHGDMKHQLVSMSSPMHSPLAYPTPPSSHENVTQSSSPYVVEDGHQFADSANAFFTDKCNADFLAQANDSPYFKSNQHDLSDNEKILKLKSVLEESAFDTPIKVEDLLNASQNDTECDLREFTETNLSFLDEDQEFLNDSRNATSPLSESFFTSGIGSAEEVKEVLREVLPEENMNLNCENQGENIIDLYYLPGLGLQSQMMPNSEDPLLSSSPRDFGHQRLQQQILHMPQQIQVQQQQQQHHQQQLQQQQHHQQQQHSLYQQQQLDQQQQQQQNDVVDVVQQQGNFGTHPIIMPLSTAANTTATAAVATQLQYNVQNLPQVQTQPQFIETTTIQNMNSIDAAMMQPIIYTGSTDKEEINITAQQTNISLMQNAAISEPPTDPNIYFTSNSTTTQLPPMQALTTTTTTTTTLPIPASVISTLQPLSNQTNSILKRRLRANGSSDSSTSHTYSKYHALSPYRSKLRKPSRTHYTPAPILNPDRKGVGLYCNVRKELGNGLISFDTFDDDFDDPVGLVDFSDESKVNLGSAYQAQIPICQERDDSEILDTVSAEQMWEPSVQMDEKILMRYIDLSKSSAVPMGSHSEEIALQTLLKAEGNTASAVLTLLQTQSNSFQMKWTAYELETFLRGLEKHGKNFSTIAVELGSKSTGECVQMYYFWKKLCVDYKVSHLKAEIVNSVNQVNELKPYVCEVPDCSASFTSKAALHGHTRIHTYGRNANNQTATTTTSASACATQAANTNAKDPQKSDQVNQAKDSDYPCKVCGKVFNKVKSRSAHMKTHRIQETDTTVQTQLQQQQQQLQQPQ